MWHMFLSFLCNIFVLFGFVCLLQETMVDGRFVDRLVSKGKPSEFHRLTCQGRITEAKDATGRNVYIVWWNLQLQVQDSV